MFAPSVKRCLAISEPKGIHSEGVCHEKTVHQRRLGIFFLALCLMAAFGASASLTWQLAYANQFTLFES